MRTTVVGGISFIVILMVFVVTVLFISVVMGEINTAISGHDEVPAESKQLSADYNDSLSAFDIGFAVLVVGSLIATIVAIRSFPESSGWFVVGGFILAVALGFVGFILENMYSAMTTQSATTAIAEGWSVIPFFMNNLVTVIVVYTLVCVVAAVTSDGGVSF